MIQTFTTSLALVSYRTINALSYHTLLFAIPEVIPAKARLFPSPTSGNT